MHKKALAILLTLQFLPLHVFSQGLNKNQEVEILLDKPAVTFKEISDNTGLSPISIYAMAAAAAVIKDTPKRTLDEATNKVLEIMRYLQRNDAVYQANPALKRKLSEAFLELRHKYTYEYMRAPLKNQEIPSMITNDFVFVLDNLKYPKGNTKLKELVKEFNTILGRKKPSASHAGMALLVLGGITTLALLPSQSEAQPISNKRTLYTRMLSKAKETSPETFTLTAIELSRENKKLIADIIANHQVYYPLLKQGVDAMTEPATVTEVNKTLSDTRDIQSKKTELKTLFKDGDYQAFKDKYTFNN